MDNNYVIPLSLGIQSPPENGFMEPEYYAFRRWLNTPCSFENMTTDPYGWWFTMCFVMIYYGFNDYLLWVEWWFPMVSWWFTMVEWRFTMGLMVISHGWIVIYHGWMVISHGWMVICPELFGRQKSDLKREVYSIRQKKLHGNVSTWAMKFVAQPVGCLGD